MIIGPNQKFIHHDESDGLILVEALAPGMTVYGLAQKYNVAINLILNKNPDLDPNTVPLGYPVNIPVSPERISFAPPDDEKSSIVLSYRVQPKETLYRISKVYLNSSPEVISTLNPGAEHGLAIGQVLNVGWMTTGTNTPGIDNSITDSTYVVPKDYIKEAGSEGKVIHEQKGLAVWKPGNLSSNYYVLHPTAKLGSYMEITNPMLHRTITAKVAGHIPPGLYQSHVGIVVSPSTARALGVLDQQFFARWRYVE